MDNGKVSARMGELDLWKFVFAFIIAILHFGQHVPTFGAKALFQHGSIGVDFFFIVSGFLMCRSAQKKYDYQNLTSETLLFIKNKIKAFLPYYIFALIVSFIATLATSSQGLSDLINSIRNLVVEFLLLRQTGLNFSSFTITSWYLSVMIFSLAVLYPLILKHKEFFTRIVAPILGAFLLGYLYLKFGHFRTPQGEGIFFMRGTIRGFAEINLGVFCYEVCQLIKKVDLTLFSRIIMTIIEYLGLAFVILYSNHREDQDPICVIIIAVAVIIAGGNFSIFSEFLGTSALIQKLGKFSLMLFMNHGFLCVVIRNIWKEVPYYPTLFYFLTGAIIMSLLCWLITDAVRKLIQKRSDKLLRIIIKK